MNPLNILKEGGIKFVDALARLNASQDAVPYCAFVRRTAEIDEPNDQREVAQGLMAAFDKKKSGDWIDRVPDVVPFLKNTLAAGFDPAWTDEQGKTLLHHAAAFGTPKKAETACSFLAEEGVNVMAKDRQGFMAISYIADSLWAGSSPLNDILHKPLTPASHSFARALLKLGENPNAMEMRTGHRPLHQLMLTIDGVSQPTVMRDNLAEILLEAGARPNIPDAFGRTALHLASMVEDGDRLCDRLIAFGADPLIRDCDGNTAAEMKMLMPNEKSLILEQFVMKRPSLDELSAEIEIAGDLEGASEFPPISDVPRADLPRRSQAEEPLFTQPTPPMQPVPADSDELSMSIGEIAPPVMPVAPTPSPNKARPTPTAPGGQSELF